MTPLVVSFAQADKEAGLRVAVTLEAAGYPVMPLPDTDSVDSVIAANISKQTARFYIFIWSARAAHSTRVRWELDEASSRPAAVMFALPIDDAPTTPFDRTTTATVILRGSLSQQLETLLHSLGTHFLQPETGTAQGVAGTAATRKGPAQGASGGSKPELLPATVFLCYRRDDTQDAAGRLHDRLTAAFGDERIFIDIDNVPLGIDFVDHVREQIARCSAVIVMIGRQWLTITDKRGRRRLDNPDDLVRAEIAAALQQRVPVIPVIVQNAEMPSADDFPDDIKLLARRNGIHLRPEQWREGVEKLLRELEPIMKPHDT